MAEYTVDKGAYLKLDHWGTDYSWVLNSKPFKSNSHYTYVVKKGDSNHSRFRFGG
ncbi:hypothetical protein FC98_GL001459 [Lentilactobacillus kisonensis DSM 19906 = JCM 15041]|uniref:Uncharacterized protein n=1 Tax=Lentilactobacillus kisonensis DSM 19906 = JCM 15041 TaxID=1423766 RepID=A0A0R1NS91_9LACO|nr:hypothetical protein FC98_GL001459 [Lentilactobacillus kisonensis DSM 19906 = JCM 15041]